MEEDEDFNRLLQDVDSFATEMETVLSASIPLNIDEALFANELGLSTMDEEPPAIPLSLKEMDEDVASALEALPTRKHNLYLKIQISNKKKSF